MTRAALLEALADRIIALRPSHPTRVAIDGFDAAGKTMLANELAGPVEARGREVIRSSIDSFHHPRRVRYARGRSSGEGYYRDSFDLPGVRRSLLARLGPGGDRCYRTALFDLAADSPAPAPAAQAAPNAVLLFDGVFLQRSELRGDWELTIFLDVGFETGQARALARDPASDPVLHRERYQGGQRIYLAECHPIERADIVIDNRDLKHPKVRCRCP